MKTLKYITFLLLSVLAFSSCSSDLAKVTYGGNAKSGTLQNLNGPYVLDPNNPDKQAILLNWTKADYGYPAAVTYQLQMDLKGKNFANFVTVSSTLTDSVSLTNKEINNYITQLNGTYQGLDPSYTPGDTIEVEFRMMQNIADSVSPVYSASVSTKIVPFKSNKDILYIVGNGISGVPTWTNGGKSDVGNGLQVFFSDDSSTGNKAYTYTGLFVAGGAVKFPIAAGSWNNCWGILNNAFAQDNNSGNIACPATGGYYTLNIDLNAKTYSFTPYAGSTTTTYNKIGIIGDATTGGWSSDIFMTQVSPHIWVCPSIALTALNSTGAAAGFKLRANADWGVNWGGGTNYPFGKLTSNGGNMSVPKDGTYFVAFNDLTGHYIVVDVTKLP